MGGSEDQDGGGYLCIIKALPLLRYVAYAVHEKEWGFNCADMILTFFTSTVDTST